MSLLARLKPLSDRKGHKVRVYMIGGSRFNVDRGWYEVTDELAEQLRELRQDHYDPESALLFDVCTPEEAERLESSERATQHTERATIRQPASATTLGRPSPDLTSADVSNLPDVESGRMQHIGRQTTPARPGPKTRQRTR